MRIENLKNTDFGSQTSVQLLRDRESHSGATDVRSPAYFAKALEFNFDPDLLPNEESD
jgi:hypothetical protein